jgi:L-threonylcarbamoyladenylate synthase
MRFLTLEKVLENRELQTELIQCVKKGYVFFYPTDTVYGFGCDATKQSSVGRIRGIKETEHPFSVIAPSKEWITENLIVPDVSVLDRLPGPFTLIFKKKSASFMENACKTNSLGVRIPDHPFTKIIQGSEKPFVTTSANISGQQTLSGVAEITRDIAMGLDMIIDAGQLDGQASTIIDCMGTGQKEIERK